MNLKSLSPLTEYLSIASVSTDPAFYNQMEKAANWLLNTFSRHGLKPKLFPTPGFPVVFAQSPQLNSRPTLLVYGHYDVQPADKEEGWHHHPFQPIITNNHISARGASDNKGQFYSHLLALELLRQQGEDLPVNLKFIIEGEEEIGSPHLKKFLTSHKRLLKTDVAWVSDGLGYGQKFTPTINLSLRGNVKFTLTISGPKHDVHSGSYGGAIANPANVLAHVLASFENPLTGKIQIRNFYDPVITAASTPSAKYSDSDVLARTGASKTFGEKGYTTAQRISQRPTIQITGMSAGYTGQGHKNIIPASASAKVNVRTVPDQHGPDIQNLITRHLKSTIPDTVTYKLEFTHPNDPYSSRASSPLLKIMRQALQEAFSEPPVLYREGGTLPVAAYFKDALSCQVIITGWAQDMHVPNEKISIATVKNGAAAVKNFWKSLAQHSQKT